jgi:exportin-2 (importin alpha re-exporter)
MTVKSQLVPIMVSLSTTGASRLQSQIGEAVAEIAELDFPERWPTLIDVSKNVFSINHSG